MPSIFGTHRARRPVGAFGLNLPAAIAGTEYIVSGAVVLLRPPSRRRLQRLRLPPPPGKEGLRIDYLGAIMARQRERQQVIAKTLARYLPQLTGIHENRFRLDAISDDVQQAFADMKQVMSDESPSVPLRAVLAADLGAGRLEQLIRTHGQRVNKRTRDTFGRQFKRVMGVDVIASEPWIADEVADFTAENVALVSGMEEAELKFLEALVLRRVRAGDAPRDIAKQIRDQFATTQVRANLIARDQSNKFHSRLLRLRYQDQGLTRYRWRTVQDPSVRDRHRALEGKVFSYDNPPITVTSGKRAGERNNPGEDIQCRCFADPVFEDLLGPEEQKAPSKPSVPSVPTVKPSKPLQGQAGFLQLKPQRTFEAGGVKHATVGKVVPEEKVTKGIAEFNEDRWDRVVQEAMAKRSTLSGVDQEAIRAYQEGDDELEPGGESTIFSAEEMVKAQLEGKKDTPEAKASERFLSALKKMPTYKGPSHRGMNLSEKAYVKLMAQLDTGELRFKAMQSWSSDPRTADGFVNPSTATAEALKRPEFKHRAIVFHVTNSGKTKLPGVAQLWGDEKESISLPGAKYDVVFVRDTEKESKFDKGAPKLITHVFLRDAA